MCGKWGHTWNTLGGLPKTEAVDELNWSMAYAPAGDKGQIQQITVTTGMTRETVRAGIMQLKVHMK